MYKLVIQDDEGKTTVVPLIRDELTIGRKEGNTIRLTERNVSRRHAKVYRQNGAISIEDLDSYNGIRVNGTRIQGRVEVKESDRIQIGDYLIEIKSEAAEKASQEQQTQPIERVDPMATTPIPAPSPDAAPTVPTPMLAESSAPGVPAVPDSGPPLADTDPAAATAAAQPAPQQHARLVILSTNFAGQEFDLDKPAMVIGRTDENDIWVNHRSISRHHAKIVRENGRYAIVDLQSSNGVRVNGEEYGKVELRRGDMIDLGHVRLRFVDAGEDFVFGRDAQPVDFVPDGGGRSALWAVLLFVLVGGGIAGFFFMRDGGGAAAGENADNGEGSDRQVATNPAEEDADAAVEETPDEEVSEEVRELNDGAQEAIRKEDWHNAIRQADAALAIDPGSERAQKLKAQAESELGAQLTYQDLLDCGGDPGCVIDKFNSFPEDSVYEVKAREPFEKAKKAYSASIMKRARRATGGSDRSACLAKLEQIAAEVAGRLPELVPAVRAQRRRCPKDKVAARPPDEEEQEEEEGNGNGGGGGGAAGGGSSGTTGGNSGPTAAQLVNQAQAAAKAAQFGKALRLCQAALQKKRGDQQAALVCAIASCNLKSEKAARRYIRKLRSVSQRSMARQICLRNGVMVDN